MKALVEIGNGQPKIVLKAENVNDETILGSMRELVPQIQHEETVRERRAALVVEMQAPVLMADCAREKNVLELAIDKNFGEAFNAEQATYEEFAAQLITKYAKKLRKKGKGVSGRVLHHLG